MTPLTTAECYNLMERKSKVKRTISNTDELNVTICQMFPGHHLEGLRVSVPCEVMEFRNTTCRETCLPPPPSITLMNFMPGAVYMLGWRITPFHVVHNGLRESSFRVKWLIRSSTCLEIFGFDRQQVSSVVLLCIRLTSRLTCTEPAPQSG